ncbi:NEP1-INTERACTING PROTEIN-LIKE 2 [Salix purpurea]|uniref:NEP1-INTERACTING PROTEIN-LIKE 2 n=1 Tax=Salix purpurea TaxID=77065 RepID=A0A9Q0SPM8_SALPP|nr:NEP1-INTERACTING PROTEIN-LIKE 2 [Salix purpurea]
MKIIYKCPLSCAAASSAAASFAFLVSSTVSAIACKLFCAILTFEFALVGTILGAYCGAMVGLKSKSSFLHGAKVGAIMGCVLSIEFLRKAFSLWDSDDCAIGIFIHLVSDFVQILNERIERLSAHNTVCSNGKSMLKITNKRHTGKNTADTLCNGTTCSICLQEFQQGEMVCSLPPCRHIFHSSCINEWFIGHSTCPLCRKTPFMLENVD